MTREEFLKKLLADARAADAEGAPSKDPVAWAFERLMQSTMDACMRADAAEKALADMKAKADAAPPSGSTEGEEEPGEVEIEVSADAIRVADSLGIPVKGTLADLHRAIAAKLEIPGADKLAADALPGVIAAFQAGKGSRKSAAERALEDYQPPKPGAADSRPTDHLRDLELGVLA